MVPAQDGPSEKLSQPLATEVLGSNSWERGKACQEASPARAHSASQGKDLTPPTSSRGKKKKKKATRKKRRRSPSYSPSPVKKKKKKSSKKHKRHRYCPSSSANKQGCSRWGEGGGDSGWH
nr:serine/arginine repetitive matrix protein 4 [Globicephala melas]